MGHSYPSWWTTSRGALQYHESIANLTPADVYFGRGQTILLEREKIKHQTFKTRRLHHRGKAA